VKGFDGLNDGLRTDRVTLTIPANFMLIATFDKHSCVAFLPYTAFGAETAAKSLSEALENIGEITSERDAWISGCRKRKWRQLRVDTASIGNWESNEVQPMVHCLPGILAFLGHNPLPEAADLIGKVKRLRSTLGLSQEQLAQKLGIDESTLAGWERGDNSPVGAYRKLLEDFIAEDGLLPGRPGTAWARSRFSARKITALREKLGLTKAALARQIGVNVNTLWRWERGDRTPHSLHSKILADLIREA
jgi:DNA-binding transcriptional regulator YiaG